MLLHDNIWTSSSSPSSPSSTLNRRFNSSTPHAGPLVDHPPPKDAVILAVFTVERCLVIRPRQKSPVLKISNPSHPNHIWLRFDNDADCLAWEKALSAVAAQRVVGISDFEFISPIGKGASGKVFLVSDRSTGEKLALKVIDKAKVFENKSSFRHALDERLALEMVDGHPFFSRLRYAFQTHDFFYLAIDFYDGGDLYQYLRTHNGRLKEPQVRAVAAEVILALEHLHSLGFVYRDLKPENVLLDNKGHVRLADFGLCKFMADKPLTNTICGTHTYAAPEMLVRNYGKSVDLWAYGVFVYNILRGRTPYEARDLEQVIANMNLRRIRFSSSTSPELVAMIKKLLDYNANTRLGCGLAGILDVRRHSFFKGLDWQKVYTRDEELPGLFSVTKRTSGGVRRQSIGNGVAIGMGVASRSKEREQVRGFIEREGRNGSAWISMSSSRDADDIAEGSTKVTEIGVNDISTCSFGNGGAGSSSPVTMGDDKGNGVDVGGDRVAVKERSNRSDIAELMEIEKSSIIDAGGSSSIFGSRGGHSVDDNKGRRSDGLGVGGWEKGGESRIREPTSSPEYDDILKKGRRGRDVANELNQEIDRIAASSGATTGVGVGVGTGTGAGTGTGTRTATGAGAGTMKKESVQGNNVSRKRSANMSRFLSTSSNKGSDRLRGFSNRKKESVTSSEQQQRQTPIGGSIGENGAGTGVGTGGSDNNAWAPSASGRAAKTLREQMAAAAEQDDLRNFDMSEWGKISVDNDHDDMGYGDGGLWPFGRARRKLSEEERMIAGFGYCSCSAPLEMPEHL